MQEGFELGSEIAGTLIAIAAQQAVAMIHAQDDGRTGVVRGAQRRERREHALLWRRCPAANRYSRACATETYPQALDRAWRPVRNGLGSSA